MHKASLNPDELKDDLLNKTRVLKFYSKESKDGTAKIKQGMSPVEISEVVSDRLMAVVREQFQNAKRNYQDKVR